MNDINFSKSYHVRMLTERDIPLILALCEKNTQFYEHCPPFVTEGSIRDDMCALPQRKMDEPQDMYRDMALEAGSSQSCVCICTVWVTSISGWVMWMATSKVNRSGKRISSQIPD